MTAANILSRQLSSPDNVLYLHFIRRLVCRHFQNDPAISPIIYRRDGGDITNTVLCHQIHAYLDEVLLNNTVKCGCVIISVVTLQYHNYCHHVDSAVYTILNSYIKKYMLTFATYHHPPTLSFLTKEGWLSFPLSPCNIIIMS